MKNKVEQQMFDEFDFMYHHKKLLQEKEEQRIKAEEEAKAASDAAKEAEEAAVLSAKEEETKKKKQPKEKKQKVKKEKKKPQKENKEEKKIHPKYGKPYKKDDEKQRRRPLFSKRKKIEQEYKEEHQQVQKEIDKKYAAETSAGIKANITRFLLYLLIAAGIGTLVFAISFGATRLFLGYNKKADHKNISYQVGLVSDTVRVSYDTLVKDGVVYVCGNDIVTLCGFTVTGTDEEIKYISPDDGNDTVTFYKNSNRATVNKNEIRLQAPTYEKNGKLYIPMSFFTAYATGIVCEFTPESDNARASIKVYKKILNEYEQKINGATAMYEPVTFRIKAAVTLEKIDEGVLADDIDDATYKIDVTPYIDAINPTNVYGYISVVNASHRVTETRQYADLVKTVIQADSVEEPVMLRSIAAKALEAMMKEVRDVEDKTRFNIYSGYHTFEDSAASDPALDESLLGLSVELYYEPKSDFGNTATFKWFANNAYKYGFIIRYPEGKSSVTGVGFRPYILRYVGRYAATKMREENLCLEEFIEKYDLERVLEIQKNS